MVTRQLLVRLPEELAQRFKRSVPIRQRSAFVQRLLEQALPVAQFDDPLYLAAIEVERDEGLAQEMAAWDATVEDGLTSETASAKPT
jgi:hypothetical protein